MLSVTGAVDRTAHEAAQWFPPILLSPSSGLLRRPQGISSVEGGTLAGRVDGVQVPGPWQALAGQRRIGVGRRIAWLRAALRGRRGMFGRVDEGTLYENRVDLSCAIQRHFQRHSVLLAL